MKVLPEVRIFSNLAQDMRRAADRSPDAKRRTVPPHARVAGGNVAIGRQQPFKGISEIDNVLFAGAPVVRAKMVIANKGNDGLEGR